MFDYFGSKKRLAPTYDPPTYDTIIEPFAGAAAYSMLWLTRRREMTAILYDIDPMVIELWTRLLDLTPEELWHYPDPVKGERTTDPIYLTATVTYGSWVRASKGKDYQISEWMHRDFPEIKRRMADTLAHVRGRVTIHDASYEGAHDVEATWFIDPPYQTEGHQYALGNAIDFAGLGDWCRSRQGQVIVCESLGADWLEFTPHRMTKTVANASSNEVVWYSHPEPTLLDLIS